MGGKSTTSTSSVAIPPEVMARYNAVNARAEDVAKTPFKAYGGDFVAPLSPTQQSGIQNTNYAAGSAQPYYGAATGLTLAGAQDVGKLTGNQIGQYMDPFVGSVVSPTLQALQQQQGQERSQLQTQAIKSGAFGGDRAGLERANLARQQGLGTAQAIAPLLSQAYGQAVQTAQGQQGVAASDLTRRMQAGQQLAGLGTGAQQAALQGAQAQIGAGTLEQQTQQADLTARYQQFLQERGYDFQVAQFLANIAMGTGALSGSTTTTTTQSDARLKDNIEPIGKTFDGQPIFRYDYGDGRTQIGLMAQEVIRHGKPGVVVGDNGYLAVDYHDATDDAAAMASQGGAVQEPGEYNRGGYVGGGLVGSEDIKAILASQAQAFGPFSQAGLYGGQGAGAGAPGGTGIVPSAKLPVPKLVTSSASAPQQPSGISQAAKTGESIAGLYRAGKEFKKDYNTWQEGREAEAAKKAAEAAKTTANAAKPGGGADAPAANAKPVMFEAEANSPQGVYIPEGAQSAAKNISEAASSVRPEDLFSMGGGFAYGGLVPRRGFEGGGTPEEQDTGAIPYGDDAMTGNQDILGDVVKASTPKNLSLQKPDKPPTPQKDETGSTIGSLVGGIAGSFFGPMGTMLGSTAGRYLGGQFAEGGLVPRQAHADGEEVIPDYSVEADLPAVGAVEASAEGPGLVPRKYKIDPQRKEEMDPHWQDFINYIYPREGGLDKEGKPKYNVRQGTGRETFDIEAGHPGLKPAPGGESSAAGAGQFINATWNRVTGGAPMTEAYQDAAMKALALDDYKKRTGRDLDVDLREKGLTPEIKSALKPTWMGIDAPTPPGLIGRKDADLPAKGASEAQYRNQEPGLIESLGDKLTSERYLVPALSFLGSWMSSRAPHKLQAFGEGLAGGVAGYQSMQKQQMETAKSIVDMVGNRFERFIKPGDKAKGIPSQVMYRNKLTSEEYLPNQMSGMVYNSLKSAGIPPEMYGVSKPSSGGVSAPSAPSVPALAGAGTGAGAGAGAQAEKGAEGAGSASAAAPAKAAPAQKDIVDMSKGELKLYFEKNPQAAGFEPNDPNNPQAIRRDILANQEREQAAVSAGLSDEAAKAQAQVKYDQERLERVLNDAADSQAKINEKRNELTTVRADQYMNGIAPRLERVKTLQAEMTRLGDIYSEGLTTGRAEDFKTALVQWADGLGASGIPIPGLKEKIEKMKINANNYDEAVKITMDQVYKTVTAEGLVRAPAASAAGLSKTTPGPTLGPGAVYSLIGRVIGESEHVRKRDEAYLDARPGTDPARFVRDYERKDPYAIKKEIARGLSSVPLPKDPSIRAQVDSLYKTYGPYGYKPMGVEEAAPQPATSGTVNNIPFKVVQ